MVQYCTATTEEDLRQILSLQQQNTEAAISSQEARSQGFVTVKHDFELLKALNEPYPHIIAKDASQVVGYTLVMLRKFAANVPVLLPMFQQLDGIVYKGKSLKDSTYFVMGQVCIAKNYRGQGLFKGLYHKMREEMADKFDYIITEVATRNTRSMAAHRKVGFDTAKIYSVEEGEEWAVVIWDWEIDNGTIYRY